jgi:hypothetical protein
MRRLFAVLTLCLALLCPVVGNPGQGERDFGMIPNSVPG